MWLQSLAAETRIAKLKVLPATPLCDDAPEALFDEFFKGSPIALRQFARFFEEIVGDLYGCLHMANHIIPYGRPSNAKKVKLSTYRGQGQCYV